MEIVLSAAARTPIGALSGALAPLKASQIGATAVRGAVARAGLSPEDVDLLLMGNVLPAGMGQAPARQAALYADLPDATPTVTLNKMCGSGLEAIVQAARAILAGDAEVVVAGGMESMTNAPYLLPGARGGLRMGNKTLVDSMLHDGLWDVYNDRHMGSCAELCARRYEFTREAQDAFATRSYERARAATDSGAAADEIVPVEITDRKGRTTTVTRDEGPAGVDLEKMASLRPAFEEDGTVTAANASTINDGAAALVVTSRAVAEARGMPVLASLRAWSAHAQAPEWFTTAPTGALNGLFRRVGWSAGEVDRFEINEAFSVVTMAAMEEFELSPDTVNVLGGAVALGHPIGASGARIVVTLLNVLQRDAVRRGVAAICIGGGEALALAVERD